VLPGAAPMAEAPVPRSPAADRPPTGSPRRTVAALRGERSTPLSPESSPTDVSPEADPEVIEEALPTVDVPTAGVPTASASTASASIGVDDAILAWSTILSTLPVATRSAVQSAQPMSLERDVLTFGVPPRVLEAARLRFKKDVEAIRAAFVEHLGRPVRFNLVAAPEFSLGTERPTASAEVPSRPSPRGDRMDPADVAPEEGYEQGGDEADRDDEAIDLRETVDAGDSIEGSGIGLLREQLGATVVAELPRESAG
jgi:hypothetical protein